MELPTKEATSRASEPNKALEVIVDASRLAQALKQFGTGLASLPWSLAPYVLLSARKGACQLKVLCKHLHVAIDLPEAQIVQEGEFAVHHRFLLAALKHLQGTITLQRLESHLYVLQDNGLQRIPVAGREATDHWQLEWLEVPGTYTKQDEVAETCSCCGQRQHKHKQEHRTYRVTPQEVQRVTLPPADLARLVKRIEWLATVDADSECVLLKGEQGLLSLTGWTTVCITRSILPVEGAGNWNEGMYLPLRQFSRALRTLPKGVAVRLKVMALEEQLVAVDGQEVEEGAPENRSVVVEITASPVTITLTALQRQGISPAEADIEGLLSAPAQMHVRVERQALLQALEALAPLATNWPNEITLSAGPSQLRCQVRGTHPARCLVPVVELAGEQEQWSGRLGASYLLAGLKALQGPEVMLETVQWQKKDLLLVREVGSSEADSHCVCALAAHRDASQDNE